MGASFAKKYTYLLFYVANYQPLHEIESFEKKWPHTFLPKIESELIVPTTAIHLELEIDCFIAEGDFSVMFIQIQKFQFKISSCRSKT